MASMSAIFSVAAFIVAATASPGKATFYGGAETGNACGFAGVDKTTFPMGYYAATGSTNFDDGYGCGKCHKVTCIGPYGGSAANPQCSCSSTTPSVIVQTLDRCPECSAGHFDLDPTAMARIVGPGLAGTCGVIEIQYERVDCAYAKPIRVRNKAGTSKWWYGLHLDYLAGNGVASQVQLLKNGAVAGTCTKDNGPSFWICSATSGSFPDPPIDLKLTDDAGTSVTAFGCITSLAGDAEMTCNTNFGTSSSNPTTTSTSTTSTSTTAVSTSTTETSTATTSTTSSNGGSNSIKITNKDGINQWWYAVYINDQNDANIASVEMKASNMNGWETGQRSWGFWVFNDDNYRPYVAPFSFRITSVSGQTSTGYNVVGSINENDSGFVSASFSADAYTDDGEDVANDEKDALKWTEWFGIIVSAIVILVVIVALIFCVMKKRSKVEVAFDDGIDKVIPKETTTGNDAEEEIEVEMNLVS